MHPWLQYCHLDSIIHLNAGSFNLFTEAELDSGWRLCVGLRFGGFMDSAAGLESILLAAILLQWCLAGPLGSGLESIREVRRDQKLVEQVTAEMVLEALGRVVHWSLRN